jgi:hypothetical protein
MHILAAGVLVGMAALPAQEFRRRKVVSGLFTRRFQRFDSWMKASATK